MSVDQIIQKEFRSSMKKAISTLSKKESVEEADVQIAISIDGSGNNVFRMLKRFAHVRQLTLNDILFISPLYMPFKSKVPARLSEIIRSLADTDKTAASDLCVIITNSVKNPGDIRMMCYVKGEYKRDLTEI